MTPWEDDITEGLKAAREAKLLDEVRKKARNKALDEAISLMSEAAKIEADPMFILCYSSVIGKLNSLKV